MKFMMSVLLFLTSATLAHAAEETMKMYFNNEELTKIIESYSKASGQKFVVDPAVRGKISIFLPEPVPLPEAFNQLSTALAVNGYGISKQGDTMVIKTARNIQRDLIEVGTAVPALKPERMYTWIYTVKNLPAASINRELRILSSKDGEMVVNEATNQLIFSDWVSNLNRINEILKEVDRKTEPGITKLVDASKKEKESRRKESMLQKETKTGN